MGFLEEQKREEQKKKKSKEEEAGGMTFRRAGMISALAAPQRIAVNFIGEGLVDADEQERRRLSRFHGVPLNEVEDIHKVFKKYDLDGSNAIEFEEFQELMFQLLGVTERNDYPIERMKQFWANVDLDGGGEVDFEEFLLWFRKYFSSSDGKTMRNPAEAFYAQLQGARMPRLQEEGGISSFI